MKEQLKLKMQEDGRKTVAFMVSKEVALELIMKWRRKLSKKD